MGEAQIIDVYKIIATKVEDFNEAILVVQVRIRKFKVRDVSGGCIRVVDPM